MRQQQLQVRHGSSVAYALDLTLNRRNLEDDHLTGWDIAFAPGGHQFATAIGYKGARIWNAHTGAESLKICRLHDVRGVRFSPDGRLLATVDGGRARIYHVDTGTEFQTIDSDCSVRTLAFSPDSTLLAITRRALGDVQIWNVNSAVNIDNISDNSTKLWVEFSPDGHRLAMSRIGGSAQIWDIKTGTVQP